MDWLVALALQATPVDSIAQAIQSAEPIRFDEVGGVPAWVQVATTLVSTGAAAYAAWAGKKAAEAAKEANDVQESLSTRSQKDLREWRRVERLYVYYNSIVANPILEALQGHGPHLRQVLVQGATSIKGMHVTNRGVQDVQEAVTDLLNVSYADAHNAMSKALTEAAEAWPDPELREAIREAAEEASEAAAREGAKLIDPAETPNFDAVMNDALGALRRVVMDHDPALKAIEPSTSPC